MAEASLKTYRAGTMAEALSQVKRDLGRDAVILHTRTFRVGGWLGVGGRPMVEITASTGLNVAPPRERRAIAALDPPRVARDVAQASRTDAPGTPARSAPTGWDSGDARAAGASEPSARTSSTLLDPEPEDRSRAEPAGLRDALEEEVASIKRMVAQVLQCSRRTALRADGGEGAPAMPAASMPDALFRQYLRMLEGEVAAEIADAVVGEVRDELSPAELADESIVRATAARRLASIIPADADTPAPRAPADNRPLTIALVGPTGVGKTTTTAKLAAAYKLRHGRKVALITSDTYRIAAVDQLRTYAEIIGLPLRVVLTPTDMASACAALGDQDVILIDTAGRSPGDAERIEELRRFVEAARPHQTHLVLASTAGEAALLRAAERFAPARPDRVIFTKLDEVVNYGVLFNVARRVALRLSYVTTGQEVPDQIEQGRSERLARLVLEKGRVR